MSTQYFERDYGYGPASLRPAIKEGREYIATDTLKHTLDANDKRIELNPGGDWNEENPDHPAYISNKPPLAELLKDLDEIRKIYNDVRLYGVLWDKTSSAMTRLYDAAGITTDTTNFIYSGSVNENYDNPFDKIYPWKDCKQCNVDLTAYNNLSAGDDIRDAVVSWCGDYDFSTDGSNGFVGRYTPEFWYYGQEDSRGKIVIVADKEVEGFYHHKPSIRSHGFAVDDGNGGVTSNDNDPLANVAVSTIHSKATAGGFTLENVYDFDAQCALFMVEFASVNAQSKLGNGCLSGSPGKSNADSIGNKSGYVGTNGVNNAWYRGLILYANRWRYILGIYRQATTNHVWLCPEDSCDSYDALDTTHHVDTGVTVYTPGSDSWQNIGDFTVPNELAAFGPVTTVGSVVGDQQYVVGASYASAVVFVGGHAGSEERCGILCVHWDGSASASNWNNSAAILLTSK